MSLLAQQVTLGEAFRLPHFQSPPLAGGAEKLSMNGEADSGKLRQILSKHLALNQPDSCVINIRYNNGVGVVPITLPDRWRVRVTDPLLEDLYAWLKPANVDLEYETSNMLPPPPPSRRYRNAGNGGGNGGYQAFQGADY